MSDPGNPAAVSGRPRRPVIFAAIAALVVVAAGLAFVVGVGSDGGSTQPTPSLAASATPYLGDLPLVTVAPTGSSAPIGTPVASASPASPASAGPSASPGPSAALGIRATRIRISRLDIDLRIIEGDGIDAPIGKAAHHPSTAWPGGGSNIYIYGHAREGMFITLWKAKVGDTVVLDLVDGTSRTYTVTKVLPKVPWDAVRYLKPTRTEQLTLQTSTSYYPTAPRFIVIAVPAT